MPVQLPVRGTIPASYECDNPPFCCDPHRTCVSRAQLFLKRRVHAHHPRNCSYRQAEFESALTELTKSLGLNPKNAIRHNYLGITASQRDWQ